MLWPYHCCPSLSQVHASSLPPTTAWLPPTSDWVLLNRSSFCRYSRMNVPGSLDVILGAPIDPMAVCHLVQSVPRRLEQAWIAWQCTPRKEPLWTLPGIIIKYLSPGAILCMSNQQTKHPSRPIGTLRVSLLGMHTAEYHVNYRVLKKWSDIPNFNFIGPLADTCDMLLQLPVHRIYGKHFVLQA